MPRVNLTEAEAEAIRRQRQHAAEHAITWNEALQAVSQMLYEYPCGADVDMLREQLVRLQRTVPKLPKE